MTVKNPPQKLDAACAAGNAQQAGGIAHKLKSSSRSVGALKLGDLCAALESAAKAGDLAAVREQVEVFDDELKQVEASITAYLAR